MPRILAAFLIIAALAPASAEATVVRGGTEDRAGDQFAVGTSGLDIRSASVRYDAVAGSLRVTIVFADPVPVEAPDVTGFALLYDAGCGSTAAQQGTLFFVPQSAAAADDILDLNDAAATKLAVVKSAQGGRLVISTQGAALLGLDIECVMGLGIGPDCGYCIGGGIAPIDFVFPFRLYAPVTLRAAYAVSLAAFGERFPDVRARHCARVADFGFVRCTYLSHARGRKPWVLGSVRVQRPPGGAVAANVTRISRSRQRPRGIFSPSG